MYLVKRHSLPFQVVAALEYLEINTYFCQRLYTGITYWVYACHKHKNL